MAQLSEDCFAFGGALLTFDAALEALRAAAPACKKTETLSLANLAGRILAKDVLATRSVPPFDNSAVDGYAYVKDGPLEVALIAEPIAAGSVNPTPLKPEHGVRILTGAPVPVGADTILMEEDAVISDGILTLPEALKRGANLRPKGEDIAAGNTLYPAGHTLTALDCARLAAGGIERAEVFAPLRIAILSSGDEIKSGQVLDANCWVLQAVFSGPAFDVTYGGSRWR